MKRMVVVVALVGMFLVATGVPAFAAWQQASTPAIPGLTYSSMSGISCPIPSFCTAVGSYTDSGGGHALAEFESGGAWFLETVPLPAGATAGELNGVKCFTTSSCEAVGDYTNASGQSALAEVWNGGSWSIQTVPEPNGANSASLAGVRCTSASACVAVGDYTHSSTSSLLVEIDTSGTWAVKSVPVPTGATSSGLVGLACPSSTTCTAAGSYTDASGEHALVETSNGSKWSIVNVPPPTGATATSLDAVACSAVTACTVVGYHQADRWNGTSWKSESVPTPSGHSGLSDLTGVSCPSANSCYAVGSYYSGGVEQGVAEFWNGTNWATQATPIGTSYDTAGLSGVSCLNTVTCTAVGFYHDPVDGYRAWVETFALAWSVQTVTPAAGSIASAMSAVSCTSPSFCMAVDTYENSDSTFGTSALEWDGSQWVDISTPNWANSDLNGVSCTAPKACTAVGDVVESGRAVPLAESWNGTSWTVESPAPPARSGASASYLLAVTCTSSKACTAVGEYRNASGQFTMAEAWNGTKWTLETTPDPAGTTTDALNWVSCPSATDCEAAGSASPGSPGLLLEGWNGTKWTIQTAALPKGGSGAYLAGITCTSPTACIAVGNYSNKSAQVPLGEVWNGSKWTAKPAKIPGSAKETYLSGVSCPSATTCYAVGVSLESSGDVPISESWNGSEWTLQPAPVTGTPNDLASVSCPSLVFCEAVGWYTPSSENVDLAEQLS